MNSANTPGSTITPDLRGELSSDVWKGRRNPK